MPLLAALSSRRATLAAGLALAAPRLAGAEIRLNRIIVASAAGSSSDLSARLVADGLGRLRGAPVVVENRPGADGVLAAEAFTRTRPGEALLFAVTSQVTLVPLRGPVPWDVELDLVPIAPTHTELMALLVEPGLAVASPADLLAYRRSRPPGALAFHATTGSPWLCFRGFLKAHGLEMTYVSYRSYPLALPDLAAGRIAVMFSPVAGTVGAARDGKARMLLTSGQQRAPAMPDVPTAREAGAPELVLEGMGGLFGWRGISLAEREELARQVNAIVAEPATQERIRNFGALPRISGTTAFAADLAASKARWGVLLREFGWPE